MIKKRVTERYVSKYDTIILNQPLAHGKVLKQIYNKFGGGDKRWMVSYDSNSVYHICPFDGVFRDCKECGINDEDFDVTFCTNKTQAVTTAALIERINDCLNAGLDVNFYYNEDFID